MKQIKHSTPSSSFIVASIVCLLLGMLALALSGCTSLGVKQTQAAMQPEKHVQATLEIVLNQPGMQPDWPAFSPSHLVLPANSLVTITLHDHDLGNTAMPQDTPFGRVQGTTGSVAYLNGTPYSFLAPDKIAHTFTIQQLHVNVPLPGDGKESDTISFTFQTGKAGTYVFRCFDPCGMGTSGWDGPMATNGYMSGTLIVQ